MLAVWTDPPGSNRYRHDRGRAIRYGKPPTQGDCGRQDVFVPGGSDEQCDQNQTHEHGETGRGDPRMAVIDQEIAERYAIYNGDCCEVFPKIPDASIHLSLYSPPFGGLYHYSSDERDLSNCLDYNQFFEHYDFTIRYLA